MYGRLCSFYDDATNSENPQLLNPQVAVGRYLRNADTNGSFLTQAGT